MPYDPHVPAIERPETNCRSGQASDGLLPCSLSTDVDVLDVTPPRLRTTLPGRSKEGSSGRNPTARKRPSLTFRRNKSRRRVGMRRSRPRTLPSGSPWRRHVGAPGESDVTARRRGPSGRRTRGRGRPSFVVGSEIAVELAAVSARTLARFGTIALQRRAVVDGPRRNVTVGRRHGPQKVPDAKPIVERPVASSFDGGRRRTAIPGSHETVTRPPPRTRRGVGWVANSRRRRPIVDTETSLDDTAPGVTRRPSCVMVNDRFSRSDGRGRAVVWNAGPSFSYACPTCDRRWVGCPST